MRKKYFEALCAIAFFYLVIELLGITCPIKFLTGISCAGCGMSRAWLSLLRGDLVAAFSYHPLFFLPIPVTVLLLFRRKLPVRFLVGTLVGAGILLVVVYFLRLADPENAIVVFEPQQGLIPRIIREI